MELHSNGHSVFSLYFHIVLVVKYRRKVFNQDISDRAKEIFNYIAASNFTVLEEWNWDVDHIHMLIRIQPHVTLSKLLNAYKSASSRLIKKEYPHIKKDLYGSHFWSPSSCIISTGGAPIEIIRKYIEDQRTLQK